MEKGVGAWLGAENGPLLPPGHLHPTLMLSGFPKPVMGFRILQPRLTSARCPPGDRLLIFLPMMAKSE